jgi:hypothetical protein
LKRLGDLGWQLDHRAGAAVRMREDPAIVED